MNKRKIIGQRGHQNNKSYPYWIHYSIKNECKLENRKRGKEGGGENKSVVGEEKEKRRNEKI